MSEATAAWSARRTVALTLIVAAIAIGAVLLVRLRALLLVLFAAIVLSTALRPICNFAARRLRLRFSLATALVYLTLGTLLVGLAAWLTPLVWNQTEAFVAAIPGWYDEARVTLSESDRPSLRRLGEWLPEELPSLTASVSSIDGGGEGPGPMEATWQVAWGAIALLSIGVLAFYWTVNEEPTLRAVLQFAPEHRREFYRELVDELLFKVGAYIRGQLILCAIIGVMSFIAYWALGLKYALILALVAGVLEAIPIFGPTLGAIPALAVAASMSTQMFFLVLAVAVLIQTLENYLFVPRVMNRSVGIPAVVTLLALVAFGALFGLLGAVLAIPLAAIAQTLFDRLVLQRDFKEDEVDVARDYSGVIRYQLMDLISDLRRQQRQKLEYLDEQTAGAFDAIEGLAVALDDLIARETRDEDEPASPVAERSP